MVDREGFLEEAVPELTLGWGKPGRTEKACPARVRGWQPGDCSPGREEQNKSLLGTEADEGLVSYRLPMRGLGRVVAWSCLILEDWCVAWGEELGQREK